MEFYVSAIFSPVLLFLGEGELVIIEDPLLSTHSYQLLSLRTSQFVGNNRKFEVSFIL